MTTRSFTVPDLYDGKSRVPQNARIRAHRCDTHTYVEEERTDKYGNATFTDLPLDVDVVFHTLWGGTTAARKWRWFFSHIVAVSEGGTGASTAEQARANLGLAIGSDVQAWNAYLDNIVNITPSNSVFIVGDGSGWVGESGATARASLGISSITDFSFDAGEVTEEVVSDNTRLAFDCGGVT